MSLAARALDVFLPPLCLVCDVRVTRHRSFCPGCWSSINFISAPYCEGCGLPFDAPVGGGQFCGSCIAHPPLYKKARAAMLYDDFSKRLILAFKNGDRTYQAEAMAGWMQRAGQEFWNEADVLIPVPLHRWRLYRRRYNQAALLANALARLTDKKVLIDGLLRPRSTPIQGHFNRKQREDNVHGAFLVNPRAAHHVNGKNIVLIDDVLTTGATLNECSRVLLNAHAKSVQVLTLARVRGKQ